MPNPHDVTFQEKIRQEHESLRELLGNVHRSFSNRTESASNIAKMLQVLCEHLQSHFDEEEHGGFFDEICSRAPRLSERADALKQEHVRMSHVIHELIENARNAEGNDLRQRLEATFHEFSKDLMCHENKENELLLEAYGSDIGSPD